MNYFLKELFSEVVVQRCSVKKVFLEISKACNLTKKETGFSSENFVKFLRTLLLRNFTKWSLLLYFHFLPSNWTTKYLNNCVQEYFHENYFKTSALININQLWMIICLHQKRFGQTKLFIMYELKRSVCKSFCHHLWAGFFLFSSYRLLRI